MSWNCQVGAINLLSWVVKRLDQQSMLYRLFAVHPVKMQQMASLCLVSLARVQLQRSIPAKIS